MDPGTVRVTHVTEITGLIRESKWSLDAGTCLSEHRGCQMVLKGSWHGPCGSRGLGLVSFNIRYTTKRSITVDSD
jgi:hypothetical protein